MELPALARRLAFTASGLALAALAINVEAISQEPIRIVISVRLIDDSSRTGLESAAIRIDSARVQVTFDPSGQYRIVSSLRLGTHHLRILRFGYGPRDIAFSVTGDSSLHLGDIALKRSPFVNDEDLVVPVCELVLQKPDTLRVGTWVTPAPDSAGRRLWILCDGLRRH